MNAVALGLLALALLAWPLGGGAGLVRSRLVWVRTAEHPPVTAAATPDQQVRPWLFAALAGAAAAVMLGGGVGLLVGAVLALGAGLVLRRAETPRARALRQRRAQDLPAALDLLAVCLRAGSPTGHALGVVGAGLEGPLGADLRAVAALHDLGADSRLAWSGYTDDPVLRPVARAVARVTDSGSELASTFESLALQCREQRRHEAETTGRRAAVAVLAPLGLCFLPAFVCLGVVPTVLGVAGSVLG
ncbi:hypothetical protein BH20ACT5_BH20ACT5_23200 [soil metagenome]